MEHWLCFIGYIKLYIRLTVKFNIDFIKGVWMFVFQEAQKGLQHLKAVYDLLYIAYRLNNKGKIRGHSYHGQT